MPKRKVSESESEEAEISGSESSEEEKPVAKSKSSGKLVRLRVLPILCYLANRVRTSIDTRLY